MGIISRLFRTPEQKLVDGIKDAHCHDYDGLTKEECEDLGLDAKQCEALMGALENSLPGSQITPAERDSLVKAGFSTVVAYELYGVDGSHLRRERSKWIDEYGVDGASKKGATEEQEEDRGIISRLFRTPEQKLVDGIKDAHCCDYDGITKEECEDLGLDEKQCEALRGALKTGLDGDQITPAERDSLVKAGFSTVAAYEIYGVDGGRFDRAYRKWKYEEDMKREELKQVRCETRYMEMSEDTYLRDCEGYSEDDINDMHLQREIDIERVFGPQHTHDNEDVDDQ